MLLENFYTPPLCLQRKYRGGGRGQEGLKKCFFGFTTILLYNKGVKGLHTHQVTEGLIDMSGG